MNDVRLGAAAGGLGQVGPPSGEAQPLPLAGLRLLVVDDSADMIESFASLLRLDGAEVAAAGSAEEALAAAENARFDLLLSDVAMPLMNGYELLAALRARAGTARLPAVALTGFGRPEDAHRARVAGFDAHLSKPFAFEHLLLTVQRLVRKGPTEK